MFNNTRTEQEVWQWLQILYASLYLEYRKPHVITVGMATIVLLSFSLHEKEAKRFSHISSTGNLLPVYTPPIGF